MTPSPFSRANRELPRRPELPEPDAQPLPPDMNEWVADDRSDVGAQIETGVSEADAAKRRAKISEAQREGVNALAQLAAREHAANEAAMARRTIDRLAAAVEGDGHHRPGVTPFVPFQGND